MTGEVREADKMVRKDREYNEDRSSPGGMTEELLTSRSHHKIVEIVEIVNPPPATTRVTPGPWRHY